MLDQTQETLEELDLMEEDTQKDKYLTFNINDVSYR